MLNLPDKFILFDTEYTTWEGAQDRNWSGPNEHKEIVQIGAIKVDNKTLEEIGSLSIFVKPKINPKLSDFFIELTGIDQETVDREGVEFPMALSQFREWCEDLEIYSFGYDGLVMKENCDLLQNTFPFSLSQFHNIREFFKEHGIPADEYTSGTIVKAFGYDLTRRGHDALNDVRTILDGLHLLEKQK